MVQVKEMCAQAGAKGFTHIFILSEKSKVCNGLLVSHLPHGPTAFFKVRQTLSILFILFYIHFTVALAMTETVGRAPETEHGGIVEPSRWPSSSPSYPLLFSPASLTPSFSSSLFCYAVCQVTNVVPGMAIEHSGQPTGHVPELILNRFNTRLGHRIGRFLGSFFPHAPEFQGRQVNHTHEMRDCTHRRNLAQTYLLTTSCVCGASHESC